MSPALATQTSLRPRIGFTVAGSIGAGTLFLEYLRSYDAQMGRADVWLDGHRAHAVVLDGRWHVHGSQVDADADADADPDADADADV